MNARNPAFGNDMDSATSGQMGIDQLFQSCEHMQASGNTSGAIALYQAWIAHTDSPHKALAMFNLGSLMQSQGDLQGTVAVYLQCIALQPHLSQAHINLGLLYEKLGQLDVALQQWSNVVANGLVNESTDTAMQVVALNHIGRVHENKKNYDLAEQALEKSLQLDPKQPGVIQHWVHIRQKACKWPVYKDLPNITRNDMLMATSPLAMLALTDDPVQQLLTAHAFVGRTYGFKEEFLSQGRKYQHARIRIGYVSGDLCVHAVGLLLPELLEGHDRNKFEVYGYDFSPEDGTAHRERLKKAFDHLRPIHALNDRQVAEQVLADEIDVLIDLHGLSSGARPGIFALHPAPKQGTYLGFIGTTGMPWFDFAIADRHVLPEELTPYFTEKPLYVDDSFIPLTRDETPVREATRAEFGLPDDAFVMAAFGNVYKITPEMFGTWMEILQKTPRAVLWLIDDNTATTENLKSHASALGADLSRIIFTPRSAHQEYKARLKLADVFLDTFPYNCGSTTNDVIQAGVDMITLRGRTMVSRMGSSILNRVGKKENIADSYEAYAELVINKSKQGQHSHFKPRILVIRQLALGDVLLTTPIIRKLFNDYAGQCTIDVITKRPEVFVGNHWVHEVFTPETFSKNYGEYDKVINLDLAYEKQPGLHIVDAYSLYAHGHALPEDEKRLELNNSIHQKLFTMTHVAQEIGGRYVVIHMRHDTWPSRNLSQETWKQVVDTLLAETDYKIVQVGSTHEISFDHNPRLLNYLGKHTIHELKEVIEQAELYVGIDSGTLHIAATTDTPIVSFFTSAHHDLRKPLGRGKNAIFKAITPDLACYGCQRRYAPPITGVICDQGDPYNPPCISKIDIGKFKDSLRS